MRYEKVSTTKMSSKGQVVIPEDIRVSLGLETGSRFVVIGDKDSVVLKKIHPVPLDDIKPLLKKVRATAKLHGLTKSDLDQAIKQVRAEKRRKSSLDNAKTKN